ALCANGGARAEVAAGEPVQLTATIAVPPGAGKVVSAEWDLEGSGTFAPAPIGAPAAQVTVSTRHSYARPGTRFAVIREASRRGGDAAARYARVLNLARARIVVR